VARRELRGELSSSPRPTAPHLVPPRCGAVGASDRAQEVLIEAVIWMSEPLSGLASL